MKVSKNIKRYISKRRHSTKNFFTKFYNNLTDLSLYFKKRFKINIAFTKEQKITFDIDIFEYFNLQNIYNSNLAPFYTEIKFNVSS